MTQDSIITKWKEHGTTQHLTKAGVLTTLKNLQRRSKDKPWGENNLMDCSGRTTYCSFMQRDILEGQQSVEFFTHLGQMANRPERSHSWKKFPGGQHHKLVRRKPKSWGKGLYDLMKLHFKSSLTKKEKPDTTHYFLFENKAFNYHFYYFYFIVLLPLAFTYYTFTFYLLLLHKIWS